MSEANRTIDERVQRFRVYLHSAPGMWTFYDGYVDVWAEDSAGAFRAAVRELGRTSFRDRPSMASWRLESVEGL